MDKDQAEREAKAHERIARQHPERAEEHLLAAQLLREQHSIPEPAEQHAAPIICEITSRNKAAQRAESERVKRWKESR